MKKKMTIYSLAVLMTTTAATAGENRVTHIARASAVQAAQELLDLKESLKNYDAKLAAMELAYIQNGKSGLSTIQYMSSVASMVLSMVGVVSIATAKRSEPHLYGTITAAAGMLTSVVSGLAGYAEKPFRLESERAIDDIGSQLKDASVEYSKLASSKDEEIRQMGEGGLTVIGIIQMEVRPIKSAIRSNNFKEALASFAKIGSAVASYGLLIRAEQVGHSSLYPLIVHFSANLYTISHSGVGSTATKNEEIIKGLREARHTIKIQLEEFDYILKR